MARIVFETLSITTDMVSISPILLPSSSNTGAPFWILCERCIGILMRPNRLFAALSLTLEILTYGVKASIFSPLCLGATDRIPEVFATTGNPYLPCEPFLIKFGSIPNKSHLLYRVIYLCVHFQRQFLISLVYW